MKDASFIFNTSIDHNDLCARSGLNAAATFLGLYVRDIESVGQFYETMLGPDSVRFRSDDVWSLNIGGDMELLLQQVEANSPFAEVVGTQSAGLTVHPDRFQEISCTLPENAELDPATWTGGPALDEGFMVKDPEGNRVIVVPVSTMHPEPA